jgi:hypothetical protein
MASARRPSSTNWVGGITALAFKPLSARYIL